MRRVPSKNASAPCADEEAESGATTLIEVNCVCSLLQECEVLAVYLGTCALIAYGLSGGDNGSLHKQNEESVTERQPSKKHDDQAEPTHRTWIKTNMPPTPANQTNSEQQQRTPLKIKKYRLEWVTLIFLGIYTTITYCLYRTTKTQFALADRPSISIQATLLDLDFSNPNGVNCTVRFCLKNNGNSVATGVYVFADLAYYVGDPEQSDAVARQQTACAPMLRKGAAQNDRGVTLFAGEEEPRIDMPLGKGRPSEAVYERHGSNLVRGVKDSPATNPLIFGCVNYFGADNTEHHQTGFVFGLEWIKEEASVKPKRAIPTVGIYGPDQLEFYRWPYLGGWYAN